jgi:HEAT repeat protein
MKKTAGCVKVVLLVLATIAITAANAAGEPQASKDVPSLIRLLADRSAMERGSAARELGKLGERAAPAIPKLIELLGDEESLMLGMPGWVCDEAADALSEIGRLAVGPLVKATESPNALVRAHAARALGGMRPSSKEALPALLRLLRDQNKDVRRHVLEAIAHVEPTARTAIPAVIDVLASDAEPTNRCWAAGTLASLDKRGTEAIPALVRALRDKDPDVRATAAGAIGGFGPIARAAIVPLTELLSDNGLYWVFDAPDMARQRPVRYEMAQALGMIGPAAASALPKLKGVFQSDSDGQVRAAAAVAALRIDPRQKEALPALIKILEKDDDDWSQAVALEEIESLGPKAALATDGLKSALQHSEWYDTRARAATALAAVAPREAVPLLVERMREEKRNGDKRRALDEQYSDDWLVRESIAEALGKLGPDAAAAAAALGAVVADASDGLGVRHSAAASLGKIGPAARAAVPQLTAALSDGDVYLRRLAAAALGNIGPSARPAIPKLSQLSKNDPDEGTRRAAQAAIERIAPGR